METFIRILTNITEANFELMDSIHAKEHQIPPESTISTGGNLTENIDTDTFAFNLVHSSRVRSPEGLDIPPPESPHA